MYTLRILLMLTCFISLYQVLRAWRFGEISVTDTIFGRWGFTVADDVRIRNGSGSNSGAHAYNIY